MESNQLLSAKKQVYSTRELKSLGFSYYQIEKLAENAKLSRLNKSFYENLTFSGDTNDFYFVSAFVPGGVICLLSAAVYYNLTTFRPDSIDVAVSNHKKIAIPPALFRMQFHYFSSERLGLGVQEVTVEENSFRIYDIEKTVVDIISNRNKIGIEETKEILRNYLSSPHRDINKLYRYAESLGCLRTLKSYLEVLL